jgi:hypothetical protein
MKFRCPAEFPKRHGVLLARTRPACRSAAPRFAISQRHHFQMKKAAPLMDFPASSGLLRPHTCPSPTQARNQGSPHRLLSLSNARSSVRPSRWGCQDPPEPTHSVSTLSAGRPCGRVQNLSGLFRPDHVHELAQALILSETLPKERPPFGRDRIRARFHVQILSQNPFSPLRYSFLPPQATVSRDLPPARFL